MEFYTDGPKSSTGSGGFEKNNFCRCRERRAVGSKIMSLPTKEFQLSITSDLCQVNFSAEARLSGPTLKRD